MSAPESLEDVYFDELKDLWSANDQMKRVVAELAKVAGDKDLKAMLDKSGEGIDAHTTLIKEILDAHDEELEKEHCKGMEGLVKEARKHVLEEDFDDDAVRDVVIISQYQRMSHYGIAGFGTVASFARTLGFDDDAQKLSDATGDIHEADEMMTRIAENSVNEEADED